MTHPTDSPPTSYAPPSTRLRLAPAPSDAPDLRAPELYLNRELSWLEFNSRVLSEAERGEVPLLERLKFIAITASNLDEFFMVRVAGLKQQLTGDVGDLPADGMTPSEQLSAIAERVHDLAARSDRLLKDELLPGLAEEGIWLYRTSELDTPALEFIDECFKNEVFPILTPIAIDPGHPFPHVRNRSLNLGVMFVREGEQEPGFGVVQVPVMLPRLIELPRRLGASKPGTRHAFVLLEDLIARHAQTIFPGVRLRGVYTFRVTRNFDLAIDEEEAEDLLQTIQQELRRRERGNAVRLEVAGEPTPSSLARLVRALKLDPDQDVYRSTHILNVADLMPIAGRDARRELRDDPFVPVVVPQLREVEDIFAVLRERDFLLNHPYESFDSIVELIARAADDPDVLAIKQTLYRAGGDSPIVRALARAAESGKQVTALVELKARFDEESNIQWARTLEQSGVHVVYGLLGLKTHAKCLLIVRRERGKLRRYVHVSTGNYNPTTARLYSDLSLLTTRKDICEDISSLFNLLTGYSAPPEWKSLVVAPLGMHEAVLGLIEREANHARAGREASITAKMNSLVDEDIIEALYRASIAGVKIVLLIRGICCLRPGVPGVSHNIEVRAIIDRFLEHARIFHFKNSGSDELFISSADWMPRNMHRRVEIFIPVADVDLKTRLVDLVQLELADNVKSWRLAPDGVYQRVTPNGDPPLRLQARLIEMAREQVRTAEAARPASRFHFTVGRGSGTGYKSTRRRDRSKKKS